MKKQAAILLAVTACAVITPGADAYFTGEAFRNAEPGSMIWLYKGIRERLEQIGRITPCDGPKADEAAMHGCCACLSFAVASVRDGLVPGEVLEQWYEKINNKLQAAQSAIAATSPDAETIRAATSDLYDAVYEMLDDVNKKDRMAKTPPREQGTEDADSLPGDSPESHTDGELP
ncbi:MAG: hypothetical protein LBJ69_02945 [Holosporales bacterium]|jgi:hypothetical protein|nr:hypothetical protein [Holosporales bacterium]